jgi:glycosyltransferase involved in cell wall biosynthesis
LRARVPDAVGFAPPSELGAYYERAAVVCVPSRREGYGLAAREAMAYGRPLLASRVGGLLDLAGDGVVLVPPRDPAALRAALESLLSDPAERARLGVAARDRARAEFSHARTAAELVSAYRDALALGATS